MATEVKKEIQLEIAHVLFIDIVGYSKFSINEQRAAIDELTQAVRASEQFQNAETGARLIKIPTGDGMALVFYKSPEEPVECALEISRALKEHRQLRMGVHSGPVSGVIDVNGQANLAGAGLNMAQRVMDCGDAGHILLSKRVADDLGEYEHWRPLLHDLGECEVKHGVAVSIVSLFGNGIGNPVLPEKLKQSNRRRATNRRIKLITAAAFLLLAIALPFFLPWRGRLNSATSGFAHIPSKSIAVLPFENRSDDKQNSFFADGVQDEILTDLSRVVDLKVISRTSVMHYSAAAERNLREIAMALGVAHVLEGSVQRVANRVRVNAQLIDARTDAHVWAQTYDRELADIFAIQSDIANAIVEQLRAKLSPSEKAAIDQPPTTDLAAFDLYTRAKTLLLSGLFSTLGKEQWEQAIELLNQAIARDPGFFDAYCQLVLGHDHLYITNLDHTPTRLAAAEAAVNAALKLRPNSGEAHLALAGHLLRKLEYDRARAELAIAQRTLVNSPRIFEWGGYIDRRQGRWDEAIRNLDRALELDPRNLFILYHTASTNISLRRYPAAKARLDRALDIAPGDADLRIVRADVDVRQHGTTKPLRLTLDSILAENPGMAPTLASDQLSLALSDRDVVAAARAMATMPDNATFSEGVIIFSRAYMEGELARLRGDAATAQTAFTTARAEQEASLRTQLDYAPAFCALGLIDAALGRKDDALREGRRALELLPVTRDALDGADMVTCFARICARINENELAFQYLEASAQIPNGVSYGGLLLDSDWDPLRGDPRFEKIVASLAPK